MPCDECAIHKAEAEDARAGMRHLERLIAERQARPNEEAMMLKVLKHEVAKLNRENAELRSQLEPHLTD